MQGVDVEMDINIIRGAILLILILSFIGLFFWAWSRKRKQAFFDASMLPLEEDQGMIPESEGPGNDDATDEAKQTASGMNHVN